MWLLEAMVTIPKISKLHVDGLTPTENRPVFLWDSGLSGFGVRCSPSGIKTYVVKYRVDGGGRAARQRWLTLGRHGKLTAEEARKLAQQVLAGVARGEDPQAEKFEKRKADTLTDVWERFARERLPRNKPSTSRDYKRQWELVLHPCFGRMPPSRITRADVEKFHSRLGATPYQANRLLALLSRLMTLAEAWNYRAQGTNPCRYVERFPEEARARYLSAVEIQRLGAALVRLSQTGQISTSAANAVRLLLLTGARLNEVLALKWEWIDLGNSVAHLPDSKSGAKPVFLSRAAIRVLEDQRKNGGSDQVFPGPGKEGRLVNLRKPWVRICEEAKIEGVRLHDLRHTAASIAVGQGVSLPIIGKLLGHSQTQTTQRYAHVDTDPALVAANLIGGAISSALGRSEHS